MSFYTIQCPDCSARVRANTSNKSAECEYCGRLLLLSLEPAPFTPDKAYRQAVKTEQAPQKNAQRLPSAREQTLQMRLATAHSHLQALLAQREGQVSKHSKRRALILPACVFLFFFLAVPASGSSVAIRAVGSLFIAALASLPMLVVRFLRLGALNRRIHQAQQECEALQAELDDLTDAAMGRTHGKKDRLGGMGKPRPIAVRVSRRPEDRPPPLGDRLSFLRLLAKGAAAVAGYALLAKWFKRRKP